MNPNKDQNNKDEDMEEQDQVGEQNEEEGEEMINFEDFVEIEEIDKENQMQCDDNDNDDNDNNENNISPNQKQELNITKEYPDFTSKGEIYCLALNQKTGTVIIGDGENYTTFYDITKKQIISSNKYNNESVNFLKFSNDNKYLVSSSIDGSIIIFDVEDNYKIISQINDQTSEINWLEWHPKGPVFAFGSSDGSVWLYKANAIEYNMSFFHHTESTTCGAFAKEGTLLISGSEDCSIRVYKLKEKSLLHTIKGKKFHQSGITCLSISDSRTLIATGSVNNQFALSNYETGNVLFLLSNSPTEASIESIVFAFEDKYVVFADSQNNIKIFDLSQMQIRSVINLDNDNITKMTISIKSSYQIYASSTNGLFYIIDTRGNGSILMKEQLHSDAIMDFAITENEDFALTSSLDKTINLVKTQFLNE